MTSVPVDWTRWLTLVLISVIITVAGQPVPSVAAASIACAMAGAASRRPRGHDNWRLVMLPPSDGARRAGISRRPQRLADAWSPEHDSAGEDRLGSPAERTGLSVPVPIFPDPEVPSLIGPAPARPLSAACRRPCQPARGAWT
jgi:hypothetical protein